MKYFSISASARTFVLAALALVGCKKDSEMIMAPAQVGTLTLAFTQIVGLAPLTLGSRTYSTPAGDQFKITTFRQYLSNVKLTKADGSTYAVPDSYYLLDAAVPASQLLTLKDIPVGDYQSVTFTVGVDSARNVAGAQTGALDPNNGMFWTWNSGYIYTKLEGTSPQAPRAAGVTEGGLVFHIGGFKSPNNTIRTVNLPFPGGKNLLIRPDRTPEVSLFVDVMKMFTGATTVRFATLSNTMGGPNSVLVANNYAAGMFWVEHIHPN